MTKNWAEDFSNKITVCLEAGDWTIIKDGEGGKELYRNGESVCELPSLYFYAELFKSGIILYAEKPSSSVVYYAFKNNCKKPVLTVEGQNLSMVKDENLITFYEQTEKGKEEKAIFDSILFEQLTLQQDGQIGFSL